MDVKSWDFIVIANRMAHDGRSLWFCLPLLTKHSIIIRTLNLFITIILIVAFEWDWRLNSSDFGTKLYKFLSAGFVNIQAKSFPKNHSDDEVQLSISQINCLSGGSWPSRWSIELLLFYNKILIKWISWALQALRNKEKNVRPVNSFSKFVNTARLVTFGFASKLLDFQRFIK